MTEPGATGAEGVGPASLPQPPGFAYREDRLYCEGVSLTELADRYGTPLYVYSQAAMVERVALLRTHFGTNTRICYAVKSNSNLHLLRLMASHGISFDIVSGGELERVVAAGAPTDGVSFAGVAKESWEIERALQLGIAAFHLESPHELPLLAAAAKAAGKTAAVCLRINPGIDAGTHAHINTGTSDTKFGVDLPTAAKLVQALAREPSLRLEGYHVHLGSQLRQVQSYLEAFDQVAQFMASDALHRQGLRYYDAGGGFGVGPEPGQIAIDLAQLAAQLLPRVQSLGLQLVLEPGRLLVADAGVLVTRVLGSKTTGTKHFTLVDAAMNDLLRPALYDAQHAIAPVCPRGPASVTTDVVGQVCETGDFLGRNRQLPDLARGDLLVVFTAGAYGMAMASHYNSRPHPAEILVAGTQAKVIRRRERFEDLWAAELT